MTRYIDPAQKLFQHLDRLHELRTSGRTTAPVNVEIDLSNRCSRGCEWCHFAYTHTRGPLAGKAARPAGALDAGDLMDMTLARSIIDQLTAAGVRSITWTGGGEPTLHPNFDEVIRYAEGAGMAQGLYTTGGHIDPERAALLRQALTWVYISLDAADATAYKRDKGMNGFAAVIDGIRNLMRAEGSATVGLGFLLTRQNVVDVDRMVELGHKMGVDYVQFRPTVRYDMAHPGALDEDTEWVTDAMRALRAYDDDDFVIADVDRFDMYRNWQGHGYSACHWAALQTVITPNGRVWRCCNTREVPAALMGDLTHETFDDVWARSGTVAVDGHCRVMCRGHIANLTLDALLSPQEHGRFI